jgi:hypothetical protein
MATVADVLSSNPINIHFRRALTGTKWVRWLHLVERLMDVTLNDNDDVFLWNLTNTKVFTVKSLYLDLMNGHTPFLKKYIWKMKVPLKIRIFMWLLFHKVILTKDNLKKRNWQGNMKCCFCNDDESIEHLFFNCPFAKIMWRIVHISFNISPPSSISHLFGNWLQGVSKEDKVQIRVGACALLWAIWNVRNDFVFNISSKTSFLQVIPRATHWIYTWSFLQPEEQRQATEYGCNRLEMVAQDLFNLGSWQPVFRISS